jgi:N-acyl homoserine lactone hydrolase
MGKGENMTTIKDGPRKLYLMELSTTDVPLGGGRVMEMVLGCYLLKMGDGKNILIDTGMAADAPRPAGAPPAQNETNVIAALARIGVQPEQIGVVVCTHFDVDHAGYHDSFPQAEFVVQRSHYVLARGGNPRYAAARAHWDNPQLRYRLIDGDKELWAGVTLIETSGHAPGHQSVLVRLPETGAVLLAIDAVAMERLFTVDRKAWPLDDNEEELRASTKKLLEIVKKENVTLVIFGHDGKQWKLLKKAPEFYS